MALALKNISLCLRDLNFGESDVLQIIVVYKENSGRRSAVVYV